MNRNEKKLKQFYKGLAVWINAGMPEHKVFSKSNALCFQLCNWHRDLPWYARLYYDTDYIQHLQAELFFEKSGNCDFPFGYYAYAEERAAGNHYINKNRLAFIFEQAGVKQENK